jgi:hypothetical protein
MGSSSQSRLCRIVVTLREGKERGQANPAVARHWVARVSVDRGCLHDRIPLVGRLGSETALNVELTLGGRIVVAIKGDAGFDLGAGTRLASILRAHLVPAD